MILINEEAAFSDEELFFSFTDKKGIILGGNDVFVRISEYSEEEFFLKPHNMIRHPDMPKTIFYLFWKLIKDNKPMVAYVKNRTKTGRYYWVLALIFPVSEGYLSIRLKPSREMITFVEKLYHELREEELTHNNLDMHLEFLQERLQSEGYKGYECFMKQMLPKELLARHSRLQDKNKNGASLSNLFSNVEVYDHIHTLLDAVHQIGLENEKLQSSFSEVSMITKNLLIASAHLGKLAKTLTTIGANLHTLTSEIQTGASAFSNQFEKLVCINTILWHIAVMHFQNEMIDFDAKKQNNKYHDSVFTMTVPKCQQLLRKLIKENIESVQECLSNIDLKYLELETSISDFLRLALGMNVICITGKIEIAHLSSHQDIEELQEQLLNLKIKNDEIKDVLKKISEALSTIGEMNKNLSTFTFDFSRHNNSFIS